MDFESDFERRSTESGTHMRSRPASSNASHQYPGLGVVDSRAYAAGVGSGGGGPRSRSVSRTAQPSRIPTPSSSRQLSDPPRTPTPTQTTPSAPAEPESPKGAPRKPHRPNAIPPSPSRMPTVTPQTPKKRAKSPAAAAQSPSTKKPRSRAPPVSQRRPNRDGSQRRSIGEYPVPADEDMANAIPTWTQPVSPGGNWDDVRNVPFVCLNVIDFFFFLFFYVHPGSGTRGCSQERHGRILYERRWETKAEAPFTNFRTGKC